MVDNFIPGRGKHLRPADTAHGSVRKSVAAMGMRSCNYLKSYSSPESPEAASCGGLSTGIIELTAWRGARRSDLRF